MRNLAVIKHLAISNIIVSISITRKLEQNLGDLATLCVICGNATLGWRTKNALEIGLSCKNFCD